MLEFSVFHKFMLRVHMVVSTRAPSSAPRPPSPVRATAPRGCCDSLASGSSDPRGVRFFVAVCVQCVMKGGTRSRRPLFMDALEEWYNSCPYPKPGTPQHSRHPESAVEEEEEQEEAETEAEEAGVDAGRR